MHTDGRILGKAPLVAVAALAHAWLTFGAEFRAAWPQGMDRAWVGPEYGANRLQD